MITEVKRQTKQQYQDNRWMFVEPLWSFNRLVVIDVDYKVSIDRMEVMPMDYKKGYELHIPQPIDWMPF